MPHGLFAFSMPPAEHDTAALRAEVRQFLAEALAAGRFEPTCDAWLAGHDPAFSQELGRRGWIGLNWPARYGGRDRPEMERYAITEELLGAGAPVAAHWIAQRQSGPLLLRFGTEAQRERFLPAIARGACYFAICMSEPDAGSDLAAVQTRAQRVEGGWSVTGRKVWTSHAHRSQYAILFCRTAPPSEDRHAGFSQFILDLHAPGVTVRPIRLLTGEAHFNEVTLDDVFIPDDLVVGEIGNGWTQVTSELGYERSGPERFMSPMSLLLAWLGSLGGAPDEVSAELLGRLTARLWSLRQLSVAVTAGLQRGDDVATSAALVKDLGTQFEQDSIEALRTAIGGEPDVGSADRLDVLLAQAIAAAPGFTLRGGTNAILRGIVARALGVPVSETALLSQVTSEILRDYAATREPHLVGDAATDGGWAPVLWQTLETAGLPLVGIPEARGGAGGGWPEIAAVLRAAGRYAAPVPLAETCSLAGWLLAEAGLPIPPGPLTVAPTRPGDHLEIERDGAGWRLRGNAGRVPWASQATALVLLARYGDEHVVASVPPSACHIERGANLASEPRDRVILDDVRLSSDAVAAVLANADDLLVRGALVRSIQIVGALDRILDLTVEYAQTRTQFGRPLGRFQAVQQDLARLAGEVVASSAAVEAAIAATMQGEAVYEVAAAKVRTSEAASLGARIAHQLHGAIGFTHEHQLHQFTTRLWSWRDEFGAERMWAARLGRFAAAAGPAGYWDWFTGTPAPVPPAGQDGDVNVVQFGV